MRRIRLSTLMLLVVIVGLAIVIVIRERRIAELEAQHRAQLDFLRDSLTATTAAQQAATAQSAAAGQQVDQLSSGQK